ncbi:MAG: hypothetical protein LH702_29050 [Phormidesmis sp. CAN_BIN44]|jgi:hypothetical protein|nr:hypothetical protein [Phormidesmis sp. CAN_BIN44]
MKRFIVLALSGLALTGCANSNPSASKSASSVSVAPVKEFKAKEIPILGTSSQQLNDEVAVAQIVVTAGPNGKVTGIPRTSSAGVAPNPIAVLQGFLPEGTEACNLPYSALIRAMYETCFSEGMSHTDVANIIGYEGTEAAKAGNSTSYTWNAPKGGMMSMTFVDDKLTAKSQQGLK